MSTAIVLCLALSTSNAWAWALRVGAVHSAGMELGKVELDRTSNRLSLRLDRLHLPALDLLQRQLAWDCQLKEDKSGGTVCAGRIGAVAPDWEGSLQLSTSKTGSAASLRIGTARLDWRVPLAPTAGKGSQVVLADVPLRWLQSPAARAWPALATLGGSVDATLALSEEGTLISGALAVQDLIVDSKTGDIAAAGLALQGAISVRTGAHPELRWQLLKPRGQMLLGPMYFDLPTTDSTLDLVVNTDAQGSWQLPLMDWQDADGLHLKAAAHFDPAGALDVRLLEFRAELESTGRRYLASALATAGYEGLLLKGTLRGSGRFQGGTWQQFDARLENVQIDDPADRIRVAGLDGDLHMDTVAAANALRWRGVRLFKLPLGDGAAHWSWSPDRLQLSEPLSLALLGGSLRIPVLERVRAEAGREWRGAMELDQIDLLNLTTALDWPRFSGALSGRLPGFRFRDGGFTTEGDIALDVFAGKMVMSGFGGERLFGVAPSISADIRFDNLDLQQLSSVLDFGEVKGWLDGEVTGLRLLDWSPVALDARLRTDPGYPGKQRISQRAVQGLSSVGGGGTAMGGPMMKLVDSFGYAQIGLNCRLLDNVCTMGGLDEKDGGYTILRGAGIPRLTVIGHQRRVDWPVLLARLQAVASGQAPVIE